MFRLASAIRRLADPFLNITRNIQVSVLGGSSAVGQTLGLLLKEHPLIQRLTLYDVPEATFGIAMDLSHIPLEPKVEGWTGRMEFALCCSDIVVIVGGYPRRTGQTDYQYFVQNADFVVRAAQEIAAHCPTAFVVVATEPINHTLPLTSKVLECGDSYDKAKVLGVTGVDTMRTLLWLGSVYQIPPCSLRMPVICGHSSQTIVPLFSQVTPNFEVDKKTAILMTQWIRNIENQVMFYKRGYGISSLSTAYATYSTVSAILNALNGYAIEHTAFIANNDYGTKYFATPFIITANGISAIMQFKVITKVEADYICQATEKLAADVFEGESYFRPTKDYPKQIKA